MQCRHCQTDVVNQLQRLREDDAIEGAFGKNRRVGEVSHNRRARIAGAHVQDVDTCDARRAEAAGVFVTADFEDPPNDFRCVALQEPLDVIPVDRRPSVEPIITADRYGAVEVAEPDPANAGHLAKPSRHPIPNTTRQEPCGAMPHTGECLVHRRGR